MEGGKTVSVGAVYVPNSYRIHLGPDDFARFGGLVPTLRNEFSGLLRRTALERRWQFPGPLIVAFEQDPRIPSGRFEVSAEHDADVVPPPETGPRDALFLLGSQPPKHWVLTGQRLVVGRLANCDIALNDQNASRQHAELARRDDGWWIVDLDSTNGTFVNGSLVKERRLTAGDRIQVGSSRLEFGMEEPEPPPFSASAASQPASAGPPSSAAVPAQPPAAALPQPQQPPANPAPPPGPSAPQGPPRGDLADVPLWDPAKSNPSNSE